MQTGEFDVWCSWILWSVSFSCTCCHWRSAYQQVLAGLWPEWSPCCPTKGQNMMLLLVKSPGLRTKPFFWSAYSKSICSFARVSTMLDTITAGLQPVLEERSLPPGKNLCTKCSENGSPGAADLLGNGITHTTVYSLLGGKGAWGYWMHMAVRRTESQESIKVFNWDIFSKFRLNLIQILIIKNLWPQFLDF